MTIYCFTKIKKNTIIMKKIYLTDVADRMSVELLLKEVCNLKPICNTNLASNKVYITNHHQSPNLMIEIARLREISFRSMSAGTGKNLDIDEYDTAKIPFQQLFVWDPENLEIVGAYRFIFMNQLIFEGPTSHLFDLQPNFNSEIKPCSIELGRSFVNFEAKKCRYALHNLWDGLGYLMKEYSNIKYFFGKMTLYPWILEEKLDVLLSFLTELFPSDGSVVSKNPVNFCKIDYFVKDIGLEKNRKLLRDKFQ